MFGAGAHGGNPLLAMAGFNDSSDDEWGDEDAVMPAQATAAPTAAATSNQSVAPSPRPPARPPPPSSSDSMRASASSSPHIVPGPPPRPPVPPRAFPRPPPPPPRPVHPQPPPHESPVSRVSATQSDITNVDSPAVLSRAASESPSCGASVHSLATEPAPPQLESDPSSSSHEYAIQSSAVLARVDSVSLGEQAAAMPPKQQLFSISEASVVFATPTELQVTNPVQTDYSPQNVSLAQIPSLLEAQGPSRPSPSAAFQPRPAAPPSPFQRERSASPSLPNPKSSPVPVRAYPAAVVTASMLQSASEGASASLPSLPWTDKIRRLAAAVAPPASDRVPSHRDLSKTQSVLAFVRQRRLARGIDVPASIDEIYAASVRSPSPVSAASSTPKHWSAYAWEPPFTEQQPLTVAAESKHEVALSPFNAVFSQVDLLSDESDDAHHAVEAPLIIKGPISWTHPTPAPVQNSTEVIMYGAGGQVVMRSYDDMPARRPNRSGGNRSQITTASHGSPQVPIDPPSPVRSVSFVGNVPARDAARRSESVSLVPAVPQPQASARTPARVTFLSQQEPLPLKSTPPKIVSEASPGFQWPAPSAAAPTPQAPVPTVPASPVRLSAVSQS